MKVKWQTGDDSSEGAVQATADTDYTSQALTEITISAADRSTTVTVDTTEDVIDEPAETFLVQLSAPTNAVVSSSAGSAVGTITDDDNTPTAITLSVDADTETADVQETSVSEEGGAKTVRVTATVDGTTTFNADTKVTVAVGNSGDTAVEGTDYDTVADLSITISAGEASGYADFTLTPDNDSLDEDDESLSLVGSSGTLSFTDTSVSITDDDDPPTVSIGAASATEGASVSFMISLDVVSGRAVKVKWATADHTGGTHQATADTDYTSQALTEITISAGSMSETVTVQTTADVIDEPAETFLVELSDATNAVVSATAGSAVGTITDDDVAPSAITLTVDADTETADVQETSVSEEGGVKTVRVTATLDGSTTFNTDTTVTVKVGNSGDSAVEGTDYSTVADLSITISAGEASGYADFTLTPDNDSLDEDDESLSLVGSSGTLSFTDTSVSITDDDDPPTVSVSAASATEGGQVSFMISLDVVSGRDVKLKWATADHTAGSHQATADTDYTAQALTEITISAGSMSETVTVQTTADVIDEPAETFLVELSDATNAVVSATAGSAVGTITDDDGAPTAVTLTVDADTSVDNVQSSVSEGGGAKTVRVTATLDGSTTFNTDTTVTVAVGNSGDSAVEGTDYSTVADLSITISAGEASGYADFTLTPDNDSLDEDDESLSLVGSSGTLSFTDTSVSITDDDDPPTVSIGAASATEGASVSFMISLDVVSGRAVKVKWATADHTAGSHQATADTDYTSQALTEITISAGSMSETVTVATTADVIDEPAETFLVELSDATNAVVSATAGSAVGTITDDDVAPSAITLTVDADTETADVQETSVSEEGGVKTVRVTATLDGSTTFNTDTTVTVKVGNTGDSAVEGTDYSTVADLSITISAGEASGYADFTLTPDNDSLDEDDESLSLVGSSGTLSFTDTSVSITDDDDPPTVSISDASATEGASVSFMISLDVVSGRAVKVKWATADHTAGSHQATADTDYTAQAATEATIAAGSMSETVTVQTTADVIDEPAETFLVELSDATNAVVSATAGSAVGTITDDDGAPTAVTLTVDADTSVDNVQSSVSEGGGAKTVRVTATLDGSTTFNADTTVTVKVGNTGDSAVEGTDYSTVADLSVTISAGEASGYADFTLTPDNDSLDEDDESLSLVGSSGTLSFTDTSVSITDDDDPPTVSISDASATEGASVSFMISLDVVSGRDVKLKWATADHTAGSHQATADTDYTSQALTEITISAGSMSETVTVQTTADVIDEPAETFLVELSDATNAVVSATAGSAVGTITDDDVAPTAVTLTVDADTETADVQETSVSEEGGAKTVRVTATLDGSTTFNADTTVTVKVGNSGDSAVEGTDYSTVADLSVTISAGEASGYADFTLTPDNDSLDEDDESLSLVGSSGTLSFTDTSVSITDDDAEPSVSIGAASATEGASVSFMISLDVVSGRAVKVKWATADHTAGTHQATADTDYTSQAATEITISAGSMSETVTVQTTADVIDEPAETFLVELSDATNAVVSATAGSAVGTITDDDVAPTAVTLTVDADTETADVQETSVSEEGGVKTVRVTATLDGSTTFNADTTVTVAVGNTGDSAVEGTDYSTVADLSITISAGEASGYADFTLTPDNDSLDEDDESLSLVGSSGTLTFTNTSVSITDDDDPPTVSVGAASATEGASVSFMISLDVVSGRAVKVKWATADHTAGTHQATADTDYTSQAATEATISAGSMSTTVMVATTADVIDEPAETFLVELSDATNAVTRWCRPLRVLRWGRSPTTTPRRQLSLSRWTRTPKPPMCRKPRCLRRVARRRCG